MRFRAAAFLIGAMLLASCSGVREVAEQIGELQSVQQAVARKVGNDIVGIKLVNGASLNVNLVNSPLKKLPEAEKQAKAAQIAKVAYDSYSGRSQLKTIRVTFAVVSTTLIVITTNDSSDAFTFNASELSGNQSR